jgi:hypothetical protein
MPTIQLQTFGLALRIGGLTTLLAGCHAPSHEDSIASLTNDPTRLKAVVKQCRAAPESVPEGLCEKAAEAWRRRFFAPRHSTGDKDQTDLEISKAPRP